MRNVRNTRLAAVALLAVLAAACAPGMAGPGDPNRLSDGEIVAVLQAAHTGGVNTSRPGERAAAAAVRQFAQRMATEHGAANQRVQALGIAPVQHSAIPALNTALQQAADVLGRYEGAALDSAFMDYQIRLHEWELRALDGTLIPSVRNAQLRTELQQVRQGVAGHLEQARQVRGTLR